MLQYVYTLLALQLNESSGPTGYPRKHCLDPRLYYTGEDTAVWLEPGGALAPVVHGRAAVPQGVRRQLARDYSGTLPLHVDSDRGIARKTMIIASMTAFPFILPTPARVVRRNAVAVTLRGVCLTYLRRLYVVRVNVTLGPRAIGYYVVHRSGAPPPHH